MKTIIAGGRDYNLYEREFNILDRLRIEIPITEVVSGGARGTDYGGEAWGHRRGLDVTIFPANWRQHSKAAAPIRNAEMAAYAEACVLFPGKGTANMFEQAKKHGLVIYDFRKLSK